MTSQFSNNKNNSENESEISLWLDYMVEPTTLESLLDYCRSCLANGQSNEAINSMVNEVTVAVDKVWKGIESDHPNYDCRKGCSWCCHQNVAATWPELLEIYGYLLQSLSPNQLDVLKNKSNKIANEVLGKSTSKRFEQKIACVFLEDDICTIHAARPLQCRGGFSEEESYCRNLFEDPKSTQQSVKDGRLRGKFLIAPKLIYNSAQVAMTHAMKGVGMEGSVYELTVAISILLTKMCHGEADAVVENDIRSALLKNNIVDDIATSGLGL